MNPSRLINMLAIISLFLLLPSCHGQVEMDATTKESAPLISSSTSTFKDPLFFIEGQLCQHLRKIFQDSKGNLWFGTNVYDLMQYDGDTLRYITEKEGFSGDRVTGIAEDQSGNIWIATGAGLNKYDGETFTVFNENHGLLNAEIWSLMIDSKGLLWLGHNQGLSRFDGSEFINIAVPQPQLEQTNSIYAPDRITGIVKDAAGNLWLGTDGYGICKYDGNAFTHFTTKDGLADNAIYELMLDTKGHLWIGTFGGGLSVFDGEKFTNFTKSGVVEGIEVNAFFEDDNGNIWFGVENNGVYQYDGEHFHHFYKEVGLNASILSIYRDRENRFWFGGWGGLFRYDGEVFTPVTKDGPWK